MKTFSSDILNSFYSLWKRDSRIQLCLSVQQIQNNGLHNETEKLNTDFSIHQACIQVRRDRALKARQCFSYLLCCLNKNLIQKVCRISFQYRVVVFWGGFFLVFFCLFVVFFCLVGFVGVFFVFFFEVLHFLFYRPVAITGMNKCNSWNFH